MSSEKFTFYNDTDRKFALSTFKKWKNTEIENGNTSAESVTFEEYMTRVSSPSLYPKLGELSQKPVVAAADSRESQGELFPTSESSPSSSSSSSEESSDSDSESDSDQSSKSSDGSSSVASSDSDSDSDSDSSTEEKVVIVAEETLCAGKKNKGSIGSSKSKKKTVHHLGNKDGSKHKSSFLKKDKKKNKKSKDKSSKKDKKSKPHKEGILHKLGDKIKNKLKGHKSDKKYDTVQTGNIDHFLFGHPSASPYSTTYTPYTTAAPSFATPYPPSPHFVQYATATPPTYAASQVPMVPPALPASSPSFPPALPTGAKAATHQFISVPESGPVFNPSKHGGLSLEDSLFPEEKDKEALPKHEKPIKKADDSELRRLIDAARAESAKTPKEEMEAFDRATSIMLSGNFVRELSSAAAEIPYSRYEEFLTVVSRGFKPSEEASKSTLGALSERDMTNIRKAAEISVAVRKLGLLDPLQHYTGGFKEPALMIPAIICRLTPDEELPQVLGIIAGSVSLPVLASQEPVEEIAKSEEGEKGDTAEKEALLTTGQSAQALFKRNDTLGKSLLHLCRKLADQKGSSAVIAGEHTAALLLEKGVTLDAAKKYLLILSSVLDVLITDAPHLAGVAAAVAITYRDSAKMDTSGLRAVVAASSVGGKITDYLKKKKKQISAGLVGAFKNLEDTINGVVRAMQQLSSGKTEELVRSGARSETARFHSLVSEITKSESPVLSSAVRWACATFYELWILSTTKVPNAAELHSYFGVLEEQFVSRVVSFPTKTSVPQQGVGDEGPEGSEKPTGKKRGTLMTAEERYIHEGISSIRKWHSERGTKDGDYILVVSGDQLGVGDEVESTKGRRCRMFAVSGDGGKKIVSMCENEAVLNKNGDGIDIVSISNGKTLGSYRGAPRIWSGEGCRVAILNCGEQFCCH